MTRITPVQLSLFPMPNFPVRAYSYKSAVENGLNPRTYKMPDEPMDAEAILEFKVWGKSPCFGCYFRNIADGGKFLLYAYDMPITAAIRLVTG